MPGHLPGCEPGGVMGSDRAQEADQNERDHQALVDAVASGRITAKRDT